MKNIFIILAFISTNIFAQDYVRFENDTIFTTCGFKIFKGQKLTFSNGSGTNENFRYVKIKGNDNPNRLRNKTIIVNKLSEYHVTMHGDATITIQSEISKESGQKKTIRFILFFEKAIYGYNGLSPELVLPDEYKIKIKKE